MAEETNPQATTTTPNLNIGDLQSIVKIIDACSERGAFRGNEMASVGAVRDRIAAFAEANAPVPEKTDEDEIDIPEGPENTD
jgi:hypothetical protein|tara:strand:+ start:964 stop:1209 length:246 start_codon:yes stop_codon:yes gene_type:complete